MTLLPLALSTVSRPERKGIEWAREEEEWGHGQFMGRTKEGGKLQVGLTSYCCGRLRGGGKASMLPTFSYPCQRAREKRETLLSVWRKVCRPKVSLTWLWGAVLPLREKGRPLKKKCQQTLETLLMRRDYSIVNHYNELAQDSEALAIATFLCQVLMCHWDVPNGRVKGRVTQSLPSFIHSSQQTSFLFLLLYGNPVGLTLWES